MIYLARSRNDNRIFPMSEDTLLRALQECGGTPANLDLIRTGKRVRRGRWSFWRVEPETQTSTNEESK